MIWSVRTYSRISAIAMALLLLLPMAVSAQVGSGDPAKPLPLASQLRADGTLNASQAGSFDAQGYSLSFGPNGEPLFRADTDPKGWDDRFDAPGVYEGDVVAAAVSDTGDLYVAGSFRNDSSGGTANQIVRWDGRRWNTLGEGLSGDLERVRQVAARGNNVYAVGLFSKAGTVTANRLAHWDGTQWRALGNGTGPQRRDQFGSTSADIYSVAVAANGDVYIGGDFNYIDETPANSIARWDGTQWHALGAGLGERLFGDGSQLFPAQVRALAFAADGSLYVGGQFSDAGAVLARNVARWDGTAWSELGSGVGVGNGYSFDSRVEAIATDGNAVYVGGLINRAGNSSVINVAMWNGAQWQALGAGLESELDAPPPVLSLLAKDGVLYAGGTFTSAGEVALSGAARWNGTQWAALGTPLAIIGSRVEVRALAASAQGGIFAAGSFETAGGVDVYDVAHWDGTRWENLGEGVALVGTISAQVNAVAVDNQGRIYIGGFINTVGGLHVNNVAMWDGTQWHALGAGTGGEDMGVVSALLVIGEDLYVGGQFTQAGGQSASRIARWNITSQTWSPLGAGIDGWVKALAFGDGVLYAGGSFTSAGGTEALDVAAWDGTTWHQLGGDWEVFEVLDTGNEAGTFVQALAYHNGQLFIGGHFQTVHEKQASSQDPSSYAYIHNVIGYQPNTQEWFTIGSGDAIGVTTNGFSGFGTTVEALVVVNNGLYIGGTFNRGGGVLTPNLARWDLGNGAWSSPGVPAGERNVTVSALAGVGSTLVVGGSFSSLNNGVAHSVAALDTATNSWNALDSGISWVNGQARVNAVFATNNALIFGGEFSKAGPHPSQGVAIYWGSLGNAPNLTPRVYTPLVMR